MLHLQAGVHLHEEELVRVLVRDEELDGAGAAIAHGHGRVHGGPAQALAELGPVRQPGQQGRGGLLDHLLVAALQGALALTQVHGGAVGVREHLHLDVPGRGDEPLEQQGVVAERRARRAPGRGEGAGQLLGGAHGHHALAAASRGGLDQQREADVLGLGRDLRVGERGVLDAGDHRHVVRGHGLLRADLVRHRVERAHGRAHEHDAGRLQRAGEVGVLGQEAVAGVHGLGAGAARGVDDGVDVQVGLAGRSRAEADRRVRLPDVPRVGVGVGVHGHRADAEAAQGADDAHGDLAAVGHQHGVEQGRPLGVVLGHGCLTCGTGRTGSPAAGNGR